MAVSGGPRAVWATVQLGCRRPVLSPFLGYSQLRAGGALTNVPQAPSQATSVLFSWFVFRSSCCDSRWVTSTIFLDLSFVRGLDLWHLWLR